MSARYLASHPVASAVAAPVVRMWDLGADGKFVAFVIGGLTALSGDLTVLLAFVLVGSSGVDWWVGRAAAHRRGAFDPAISGWGLHSKIAGVALVGLLRLVELTLFRSGVPDPHGVLAAVTAAALIYQDLDSIDHHRQTLGGRPIPVLTAVLGFGRRLAESLLPIDPTAESEERRS